MNRGKATNTPNILRGFTKDMEQPALLKASTWEILVEIGSVVRSMDSAEPSQRTCPKINPEPRD
ncbi:MAG: hypothetical protein NTZ53_03375 [Cyanobacteria bacterium]|nr:hypothetical protein [Cyanobacteriota bacterium]